MLKNSIWLVALTLFILFMFIPTYTQMQDIKTKNQDYAHQIAVLKRKNALLREERRRLEDDPEYLEKVARDKMGLVKEGEVIYKITPAE